MIKNPKEFIINLKKFNQKDDCQSLTGKRLQFQIEKATHNEFQFKLAIASVKTDGSVPHFFPKKLKPIQSVFQAKLMN